MDRKHTLPVQDDPGVDADCPCPELHGQAHKIVA